uniref:Cyanate hydratase n=1 Tax=Timspurckia oligopyrenoides TaxID=708627 RepID=A0A7S0ZF00_9RHOD|mmetsp:Transcript_2708/g.4772  ORF Transcript_2708/g.4772 Transcript_2708/m.4772 type:complete len:169 (+) Transcript_2708:289-795(+)
MSSQLDHSVVLERTERLLSAKSFHSKSFSQIASELNVTNAYAAQLFFGQAQLKPHTLPKLKSCLPSLLDSDLNAMLTYTPTRSYDPTLIQDPHVYRTHEAVMHYARAIKSIVNEEFGDGIMSAIDFYVDVGKTFGKHGEPRVVITLNGKFLQFNEQLTDDNTAPSPHM